MSEVTPPLDHLPSALNGRWVCSLCGRVLSANRRVTKCQRARRIWREVQEATL